MLATFNASGIVLLRSGSEAWGLKLQRKIPGQQFVEAVDRMLRDTLQDASRVDFRIEANELGGAEQRVDACAALAAAVSAGEKQVCIEYLHRAITPEHSTITGSPPAGTEIGGRSS